MKKLFTKKRKINKVSKILQSHPDKIMLNIGCGTDYKDGWINIDNNSDNNIERLDLSWDMREPLPFENGSVDYIFNEHFLEHLTVEEGQAAIKDFLRVLKKGGVIRIATPDLNEVVKNYLDSSWKKLPFIKKFGLDFIKTPAELLNINFSWWGHKWLYDWGELERRISEAGSSNINRCKLRQSKHKDLCGLEIRDESTLIAEVIK